MPLSIQVAAIRLSREVPETEKCLDEALAASSAIMQTLLAARSGPDVPAHAGQKALAHLLRVQRALVEANNAFVRVHQELAREAQVYMAPDEPTCPPKRATLAPVQPGRRVA